jgi:hypothetical protein
LGGRTFVGDSTGGRGKRHDRSRNKSEPKDLERIRNAVEDLELLVDAQRVSEANIAHAFLETLTRHSDVVENEDVAVVIERIDARFDAHQIAHSNGTFDGAQGVPVTTTCAVCGGNTGGMRSDARYCSNACRQRAYRDRKAVAK